jgi:hypothetical protein
MVMFQRSFLAWLVGISAAVVAVAPEAQAKCAPPAPVMAPWSGTVPPRPVLELLVPDWGVYEAQHMPPHVVAKVGSGATPTVVVKSDTVAPAVKTFRVEIGTVPAGPLQVDLLDDAGKTVRSWSYVVDPGWKRPAGSLATVATHQVHSRWTCSETQTTNLTFDGAAAAYRVVAANSAADFAAGRTKSFVVSRAMDIFWESASSSVKPVDLELGLANCFGGTFEWSAASMVAQVRALLPDGTEQPVMDKPISISKP